jgi:hypothetical protein
VITNGSFLSEILGAINELICQSLLAKENKIGTTNVTMIPGSRINIFLETNASAFCKNIKQGSKHWNEYRMKNIGRR